MGLFDGVFAPNTGWLGLGSNRNDEYSPLDISALIQGYGGGGPPQGPYGMQSAPMLNGNMPVSNSSATTPGDASALVNAYPDDPMRFLRPGSFLDRLVNGGGAQAAPGQPPQLASQQGMDPNAGIPISDQPSQGGATLDQRAYGMSGPQGQMVPPSVIGGAPQIPQQAQAAMAQAPQGMPQAPQGGDFLKGLSNFSHNLGSSGGLGGVIDAVRGTQTGQRYDAQGIAQQNQAQTAQAVYGALVQRGIPHDQAVGIAQAASTDPKIAEALLPQALGLKPPSTVEGVIAERMSRPGMQGRPGQPQANTEDPYEALRKLEQAKATGTKAGGVIGETQATAEMALPTAVAQANEALRLTNELRTHKGRDNGVFWHSKVGGYLPDSAIPGNTDARDAVGILNQIKGGAFLEAFKALKGGGAITEIEGKKATDAIARMDRSQSRAEFDKALSDYQGIVKLGIDRANQLAGQPAPNNFKGNSDWQQVKPGVRIRQVQ